MLDSSQPWRLFGIDLGSAVHYVRAGWSEFLWGNSSPVLPLVDEAVLVHGEGDTTFWYKAGEEVSAHPSGLAQAEAVLLPDGLVLEKTLQVPLAAEPQLEAVVALEVGASSPFPQQDTCYGWRVGERRDTELDVLLVISSRSAVMANIADRFGHHEVDDYEVWGAASGSMIVLQGFGERARQARNRRRLRGMALAAGYCVLLLILSFCVAAGAKYFELQKVRGIQGEVEQAAAEKLVLRQELARAKDILGVADSLMQQYPSARTQFSRLSALMSDDTWISQAELEGVTLKVEGQSDDAPAVMQLLLNDPAYTQVDAPVAFKKQRTGKERFVLELTLAAARPAK